jgi:tellurite resistance protein
MNTDALEELCSTLEAQAAIFEICGETIDVDLHLLAEMQRLRSDAELHVKTCDALRDALAELERLRSDAELHVKTCDALRDALAEIERLRSDADVLPLANAEIERLRSEADAELHRGKVDRGMSHPATTSRAIDWLLKLLDPSNTKNKPK